MDYDNSLLGYAIDPVPYSSDSRLLTTIGGHYHREVAKSIQNITEINAKKWMVGAL
jgi:hypothetical protein